jgi:DNA-binding response OmpR family regulator
MLTARNTDLDTIVGLKQGADDYLGKPFDMGILLARMEALLRRSAMGSAGRIAGTAAFGEFRLDVKGGVLSRGEETIELHAREFALLEFLVQNPNQMLSRDRILNEVWGYESEVTTRTVDVHVAKLRQKLGESELPRHIQTIRGRGYRFIP